MLPVYDEIRRRWEITFADSSQTVNTLRQKGIRGSVCCEGLRSVCWKIYFGVLLTLNQSSWPAILDGERGTYESLCNIHVVDPAREAEATRTDLNVNNPLSLEHDSPWQKYFEDNELRKIISQDVERTFPDQDYFRSPERQQQLIRILFIWCKLNLDVSYRQGMHELLAPVLWAVDADSIERHFEKKEMSANSMSENGSIMEQVLDRRFVEHDAFALFERLMRATKPWYEFNDDPSWGRPRSAQKARLFENTNRFSITEIQKTPVVAECYKVSGLLKIVDPALYTHLESMSIEPQLYGIRWLRLLFSREFPLADVYQLWDGLFADDPNLGAVDYVCLGMLLYIRDDLLSSDYAGCLHRLMKFPSGVDVNILIEQAIKLREKTTLQTRARVLMQNARRTGRNVTDDVVSLAVQIERDDRNGSFNVGAKQHDLRYDSARERKSSIGSNVVSPPPVIKYTDRDLGKAALPRAGLVSNNNGDLQPTKQLYGVRNNGKKESADDIERTLIRASIGDYPQPEKANSILATAESATKEIERLRNVCLINGEILQRIVEKLAPITELHLSKTDSSPEECPIANRGSDTSPPMSILLMALSELMSVRDALVTEAKPMGCEGERSKEHDASGDILAKGSANPNSTIPKHPSPEGHPTQSPGPQAIYTPTELSQSRLATAILPSFSAISALSSSVSENDSSTPKSLKSPPVSRPLTVSAQAAKRTISSPLKLSLEDILNDGTEFANFGGPSNRIGIADSSHSWMFGEPTVANQSPKKSTLFGGSGVSSLGAKIRLGGSNTSVHPSNNEPAFTQPLAVWKDTSSQPLLLPIAPTSDPFDDEANNGITDLWHETAIGVGERSESPTSPKASQDTMSSANHLPNLMAAENDSDDQNLDDRTNKGKEPPSNFISDSTVNKESGNSFDPSVASSDDYINRLSGNVWL